MDFRNKYLKYSPKITFDIFEKVWNKLIESDYRPVGEYSVKKAFGDFKTLHRYFRTTESHPMEFNCYSVIPMLDWSETTVQEILGYDPFVTGDDFVLPEKWCIKIPKFKDAPKEIIDWRVNVKKCGAWNTSGYLEYSGWHSDNITDGYTEITFDQFKKYVLKQDVEENIKINYYKCIKSDFPELVLGKLYPSHDGKFVKIPHGEYTSCFYVNDGGRFELSNKSAFDAQNQPKQPQKQAVHCETQEQWDFVTEKLGYKWNAAAWTDYGNNTCVNLEYKGLGTADVAYIDYQILSFSDWCAQNNYEFLSMEDKYMEVLRKNARTLVGEVAEIYKFSESVKNMFDFGAKTVDDNLRNSIAHRDVTLQNLSKSVINDGLNDRNKVLSIDDDELPMVSAVKTNTIKKLLSND